jgi:hypothetical protein
MCLGSKYEKVLRSSKRKRKRKKKKKKGKTINLSQDFDGLTSGESP